MPLLGKRSSSLGYRPEALAPVPGVMEQHWQPSAGVSSLHKGRVLCSGPMPSAA